MRRLTSHVLNPFEGFQKTVNSIALLGLGPGFEKQGIRVVVRLAIDFAFGDQIQPSIEDALDAIRHAAVGKDSDNSVERSHGWFDTLQARSVHCDHFPQHAFRVFVSLSADHDVAEKKKKISACEWIDHTVERSIVSERKNSGTTPHTSSLRNKSCCTKVEKEKTCKMNVRQLDSKHIYKLLNVLGLQRLFAMTEAFQHGPKQSFASLGCIRAFTICPAAVKKRYDIGSVNEVRKRMAFVSRCDLLKAARVGIGIRGAFGCNAGIVKLVHLSKQLSGRQGSEEMNDDRYNHRAFVFNVTYSQASGASYFRSLHCHAYMTDVKIRWSIATVPCHCINVKTSSAFEAFPRQA